jgi:hypothetical protein
MTRRRLSFVLWIAVGVAVVTAAVVMVRNELAFLRGPEGEFSGYWLNDDPGTQRVWLIEQRGDVYTVGGLRLGGRTVGEATLQGAELVAARTVAGSRWTARLELQQDGDRLAVVIAKDGAPVRRATLRRLPTPAPPDIDWSLSPGGLEARTIEEGIRALELMHPGTKPGDYAYSLEGGGRTYSLTGLLPGGGVFVVP